MKVTEENLVREIKLKNQKAIGYLLDNYGWIIKGTVKKHLYNLKDYQGECINDILLAVWLNIDSFDSKRSEFKNWLAGVSRFKCIDYKRKYLKDLQNENIENLNMKIEDSVSSKITENELDKDIEELLSCLKKDDKDLFIKLYVEEKSLDEVSYETGFKKEIIYNRVSRGRRKIRGIFEDLKGGKY